jgi:hypothetical protein
MTGPWTPPARHVADLWPGARSLVLEGRHLQRRADEGRAVGAADVAAVDPIAARRRRRRGGARRPASAKATAWAGRRAGARAGWASRGCRGRGGPRDGCAPGTARARERATERMGGGIPPGGAVQATDTPLAVSSPSGPEGGASGACTARDTTGESAETRRPQAGRARPPARGAGRGERPRLAHAPLPGAALRLPARATFAKSPSVSARSSSTSSAARRRRPVVARGAT